MNQITLRQIPEKTYRQLRMLANKNKTSINKTLLVIIHKYLGLDDSSEKARNLRDIAGTWNAHEYEEFVQIQKKFDVIDKEVWK